MVVDLWCSAVAGIGDFLVDKDCCEGGLSYIVNMIVFMRMPVAVVTVGGHVATSLPMRL